MEGNRRNNINHNNHSTHEYNYEYHRNGVRRTNRNNNTDPYKVLFLVALIVIVLLLIVILLINKDDSKKTNNDSNATTTEATITPTKEATVTPEVEPTKAPTEEPTPAPAEPTATPEPTKAPAGEVKIDVVDGKYIIPSIAECPALLTKKIDVFLKADSVETWTSLNDNGLYFNRYGEAFTNNYDGTMTGKDGVKYTIGHVNVLEKHN